RPRRSRRMRGRGRQEAGQSVCGAWSASWRASWSGDLGGRLYGGSGRRALVGRGRLVGGLKGRESVFGTVFGEPLQALLVLGAFLVQQGLDTLEPILSALRLGDLPESLETGDPASVPGQLVTHPGSLDPLAVGLPELGHALGS